MSLTTKYHQSSNGVPWMPASHEATAEVYMIAGVLPSGCRVQNLNDSISVFTTNTAAVQVAIDVTARLVTSKTSNSPLRSNIHAALEVVRHWQTGDIMYHTNSHTPCHG